MNKLTFLFPILIFLFCFIIVHQAVAQTETDKYPKPKIITEEDLQRQKQNEESQKRFKNEREAGATQERISEYHDTFLNDIFKFCFLITTLLGISTCLVKGIDRGLKLFLSILILLALYFFNCFNISEPNEMQDCIFNTFKVGLITISLSSGLVLFLMTVSAKKDNLTNSKKSFYLVFSILFTATIAFLLTNNITLQESFLNTEKSNFMIYPWNWLSFLFFNGFLFYNLKIKYPFNDKDLSQEKV